MRKTNDAYGQAASAHLPRKNNRSAIRESAEQKKKARQEMIKRQKEDAEKIRLLEKDGKIDFATLPVIEMRVREILLKWLSDAMENVSFQARTEDGRRFFLDRSHMDENVSFTARMETSRCLI